jgi:hypothetical protein
MSVFCATCYSTISRDHLCEHVSLKAEKYLIKGSFFEKDTIKYTYTVKCMCCNFTKLLNDAIHVHTCNFTDDLSRDIVSMQNKIIFSNKLEQKSIDHILGYVKRSNCKICRATGKTLKLSFKKCVNCDGTGGIICHKCNGMGHCRYSVCNCDFGYKHVCHDCNGRKAVISNRTYVDCTKCKVIVKKLIMTKTP